MKDKRGQIADTMTWVVATVVIIVILVIAVFIVSSSPFKGLKKFKAKEDSDLLVTKSMVGYLLSDGVYEQFESKQKPGDEFNNFNKEFPEKLFKKLYENYYGADLSMYFNFHDLKGLDNRQELIFGKVGPGESLELQVSEAIKFKGNKDLRIIGVRAIYHVE